MDELTADQVYAIFLNELRKDDGLDTKKLRNHPALVELLVDDGTPEDAKSELEAIVLSRGDGDRARALRNILVVSNGHDGIEARSGPEERRRWATGEREYTGLYNRRLVQKSSSSHVNHEKEEIREVVRLIFDRAAQRKRAAAGNGAFQALGEQQMAEMGHIEPFAPADPIDTSAALPPLPPLPEDEANHDDAPDPVEPADQAPAGRRIKTYTFIGLILASIAIFFPIGYLISKAIGPSSPPATSPSDSRSRATPSVTESGASSDENSTTLWQPPRQTYSIEGLLAQPVLNSITDLPGYGDERDFFMCQDLTANGGWRKWLRAVDRHTYLCQLLYHNDDMLAGDHLPATMGGTDVKALLQNTRARVRIPAYNWSVRLQADVAADNANPSKVYDTVIFSTDSMPKPVTLTYVPGSARLFIGSVLPNDGVPLKNDAALTSTVGALVGSHQDGIVDQNPGYIQFEVTVTLG